MQQQACQQATGLETEQQEQDSPICLLLALTLTERVYAKKQQKRTKKQQTQLARDASEHSAAENSWL